MRATAQIENEVTTRKGNVSVLLIGAGVAAICVAVYWPALSSRAVMFDDEQYLDENALVQTPGWRSAERFLTEVLHPSTVGGYYQPLAMISLMTDYALGGRPNKLAPFHATSLTLHAINSFLVVLFMWELFGSPLAAGLTGLVFGLHPMNVESIPWLAERKTLLGAFFAFLTLILYVRYVRNAKQNTSSSKEPKRPSIASGWYVACLVAFVFALLSKPTVTPLPFCMLVLDVWPLKRFGRRAVLEKAPFLILAGVSAIITVLSQRNTAEITRPLDYPAGAIPLIISHNIVFYLRKLLWPCPLSAFYAFPDRFSLAEPAYLIGVVGTATLAIVFVIFRKRLGPWIAGLLFFFVAILPTLGIIGFTAVIAADRFVYLPMIGILIPVALVLARSLQGGGQRRGIVVVGVVIICGIYAASVRAYLREWTDSETLTKYMLGFAPNSSSLRLSFANALNKQDRRVEAIEQFQLAAQYAPSGFHSPRAQFGRALFQLGKVDEAAIELRAALDIKPDAPEAHLFLADCLAQQGKFAEADQHYRRTIELRPSDHKSYYNYGTFLARFGRSEEAIDQFNKALKIKPDHALTLYNVGLTYFQLGKIEDALMRLSDALAARPDMAKARYQLARANLFKGRIDVGLEFWRAAIRQEPRLVEAMTDLAWLLATSKDDSYRHPVEALRWATQACEVTGNREPMALDTLAAAHAARGHFAEAAETETRAIEGAGGLTTLSLGARTTTPDQMRQRLKLYSSSQPYLEKIQFEAYQPPRPPKQ